MSEVALEADIRGHDKCDANDPTRTFDLIAALFPSPSLKEYNYGRLLELGGMRRSQILCFLGGGASARWLFARADEVIE
jgi:hypothetical protein